MKNCNGPKTESCSLVIKTQTHTYKAPLTCPPFLSTIILFDPPETAPTLACLKIICLFEYRHIYFQLHPLPLIFCNISSCQLSISAHSLSMHGESSWENVPYVDHDSNILLTLFHKTSKFSKFSFPFYLIGIRI